MADVKARMRGWIEAVICALSVLLTIAVLTFLVVSVLDFGRILWPKRDDRIRELVERASRPSRVIDGEEDVWREQNVGDAKPDFSLTAKALGEEYKKDNTAASAKYKGKVVELTGVVRSLHRLPPPRPNWTFDSTEACLELKDAVDIKCFTADKNPWRRALPGQRIKLKGRVAKRDGADGGVLFGC